MSRIGPTMQRVINFVAANPGCCKAAAAREAFGERGFRRYGYPPVDRCIRDGHIDAVRLSSGVYRLTPVAP